jgi:hypothetical protein
LRPVRTLIAPFAAILAVATALGLAGAANVAAAPAARAATVTMTRQLPALTLSTRASTALYGSTIHVTAHLGRTYANRTVSLYARLAGTATRKLLKTDKVSSAGNLTTGYPRATRNVIFTVTFSGDSRYRPRSVSTRVGVDVRVSMSESGWSGSTKHKGTTYRVIQDRDFDFLNLTVSLTPSKPGEIMQVETQRSHDNGWPAEYTSTLDLDIQSNPMLITLGQGGATVAYYRVRAVISPGSKDVTNVNYHSSWFYYEVVK